jgi:hypothetical protein
MIIHGGYAKFLRDGAKSSYNDIDLFATTEDLDSLCALFSDENYVCHRGKTPVPNREVVLLIPRDKNLPIIKFDAEVVSSSLRDTVLDLPDTAKTVFMGLSIGVASDLTDMIIKEEVMDFSHSKHAIDVAAYKTKLGDIDTKKHEPFRAVWAKHIAAKYGPKGNRKMLNTQLASKQ